VTAAEPLVGAVRRVGELDQFVLCSRPDAPGERRPPVLLVHSVSAHAHSWLPTVSRMHDGSALIAPDLRGHGYSDWTRSGYWLADYAADLVALCDLLELDEVDVVGASMGGRIAALVAAQLGPRARRLVLLDAGPVTSARANEAVKAIRGSTQRRTSFRDQQQVADFWSESQPTWTEEACGVRARDGYRENWAGRFVSRNDPEAELMFGAPALAEVEAVWAALAATTADVTVVHARESFLLDEELAHRVADTAPRGHYLSVPGGHYLCYEDHDRLAGLLDQLLTASPGAPEPATTTTGGTSHVDA
jgi:pimeloyl-ACP methyl ester carboxylesterase